MPKLKAKRKTVTKLERTVIRDFTPEEVLFYQRNSIHTSPILKSAESIDLKPVIKKGFKKFIFNPYSAVFVFLLAFISIQFAFPALSLTLKIGRNGN